MARARLFRPVTDEAGNLLYGAQVTVRNQDASGLLSQPLYADSFSGETLENPFTTDAGYISLWLDTPERLNLLIEAANRTPITVILDAQPPASEVVRSVAPLVVTNAPAAGQTLVATSGSEAAWQTITAPSGTVAPHNHEGTGAQSVALGDGASASDTGTTAVGDNALATAPNASAYGKDSQANASGATAVGEASVASASDGTAIGHRATASGSYATAVGGSAVAAGSQSTAFGHGSQAVGSASLALGDTATASGDNSVAIGSGATASHTNAVAVGDGAATSADDQVALGTADHTVLATGGFQALADAHLGSVDSVLAFFGTAGATIQTVTGSDGGDLTVRGLVEALAAVGLIVDGTTKG